MGSKLELTFFQKLQISRYGQIPIGKQTRSGWKGPMMFYAFKCRKHGYVSNYVSGTRTLRCPKCQESLKVE